MAVPELDFRPGKVANVGPSIGGQNQTEDYRLIAVGGSARSAEQEWNVLVQLAATSRSAQSHQLVVFSLSFPDG
jgi:hypothetical protein